MKSSNMSQYQFLKLVLLILNHVHQSILHIANEVILLNTDLIAMAPCFKIFDNFSFPLG